MNNKQKACVPKVWDATKPVIGALYEFPEIIETGSLRANTGEVEEEVKRPFKIAWLIQTNERVKRHFFLGHKVTAESQNSCGRANKKKYLFSIPFPENKK